MNNITCSRKIEWDSMHRVPGHDGACRAYHGHRYSAEIHCEGVVKKDGMIIDFGVVKKIIGGWIDKNWDHTAIFYEKDTDEAIKFIAASNKKFGKPVYFMKKPPTSENIAEELFSKSNELLKEYNIKVCKIRLWETPNCAAICE